MLIELGNKAALNASDSASRVTYLSIPSHDENGLGGYSFPDIHDDSLFPNDLSSALNNDRLTRDTWRMLIDGYLAHPSGVKGFPNHEVLSAIIDPGGAWTKHSSDDASWVYCPENSSLETLLSKYFGCAIGRPSDLEYTHWTRHGMPGVGPDPYGGATMFKTSAGNDIQSLEMGGGLVGETGTATATSATSLTTNSATSHATNDLLGQSVVAWSSGAYGLITANTSGMNTVLTVDRWYVPATPGGSAAATPSATTGYTIMPGGSPVWFCGLTANSTTPVNGDITLVSEITTAGGGLVRKICPFGHTAGVGNFTLTPVYTANGSDTLPVTVAKAAFGASITSGARNMFQTLLPATATFSLSGDQVTLTETVSL